MASKLLQKWEYATLQMKLLRDQKWRKSSEIGYITRNTLLMTTTKHQLQNDSILLQSRKTLT